MRTSDALDLEPGVFTQRSARAVAQSLKRSADRSRRRKSAPFRSAMSMLNFHINRAGRTLTAAQKRVLERAKDELRRLYGRGTGRNTADQDTAGARPARAATARRVQAPKKTRRTTGAKTRQRPTSHQRSKP